METAASLLQPIRIMGGNIKKRRIYSNKKRITRKKKAHKTKKNIRNFIKKTKIAKKNTQNTTKYKNINII